MKSTLGGKENPLSTKSTTMSYAGFVAPQIHTYGSSFSPLSVGNVKALLDAQYCEKPRNERQAFQCPSKIVGPATICFSLVEKRPCIRTMPGRNEYHTASDFYHSHDTRIPSQEQPIITRCSKYYRPIRMDGSIHYPHVERGWPQALHIPLGKHSSTITRAFSSFLRESDGIPHSQQRLQVYDDSTAHAYAQSIKKNASYQNATSAHSLSSLTNAADWLDRESDGTNHEKPVRDEDRSVDPTRLNAVTKPKRFLSA